MVYLYLDADYQKVRHDGQVRDMAVLKAVGVNEQGKREVLAFPAVFPKRRCIGESF